MPVAGIAALVGGSALADVFGAHEQASAAKSAAQTQTQYGQQALNLAGQLAGQRTAALAPYAALGPTVMPNMLNFLQSSGQNLPGWGGPSAGGAAPAMAYGAPAMGGGSPRVGTGGAMPRTLSTYAGNAGAPVSGGYGNAATAPVGYGLFNTPQLPVSGAAGMNLPMPPNTNAPGYGFPTLPLTGGVNLTPGGWQQLLASLQGQGR